MSFIGPFYRAVAEGIPLAAAGALQGTVLMPSVLVEVAPFQRGLELVAPEAGRFFSETVTAHTRGQANAHGDMVTIVGLTEPQWLRKVAGLLRQDPPEARLFHEVPEVVIAAVRKAIKPSSRRKPISHLPREIPTLGENPNKIVSSLLQMHPFPKAVGILLDVYSYLQDRTGSDARAREILPYFTRAVVEKLWERGDEAVAVLLRFMREADSMRAVDATSFVAWMGPAALPLLEKAWGSLPEEEANFLHGRILRTCIAIGSVALPTLFRLREKFPQDAHDLSWAIRKIEGGWVSHPIEVKSSTANFDIQISQELGPRRKQEDAFCFFEGKVGGVSLTVAAVADGHGPFGRMASELILGAFFDDLIRHPEEKICKKLWMRPIVF